MIKSNSGVVLGSRLNGISSATSLGVTSDIRSSNLLVSSAGRASNSKLGRTLPSICSAEISAKSLLCRSHVPSGSLFDGIRTAIRRKTRVSLTSLESS